MASPADTAVRNLFPESFREDIDDFWGMTQPRDMYYDKVFYTVNNTEDQYEMLNRPGLGYAKRRNERDPSDTDSVSESYKTVFRPVFFTKRISFSVEFVHQDKTMIVQEALQDQKNVMMDTCEAAAASVFNTATSTTLPAVWGRTGGDKVALLSTAHPVKEGPDQSNTGSVYRDLTTNAIESLLDRMLLNKNDRNLPRAIDASKLVCAGGKRTQAEKVCGSMFVSETTDNAKNVIRDHGMTEKNIYANPYITNPNFWALIANDRIPDNQGLIFVDNMPLKRTEDYDSNRWVMYHNAGQMISVGVNNFRKIWGYA